MNLSQHQPNYYSRVWYHHNYSFYKIDGEDEYVLYKDDRLNRRFFSMNDYFGDIFKNL